MNSLGDFLGAVLHLDVYLTSIVQQYGILTYPLLFLIIFLETGIVIFPFLPGDSLLFTAGAIAAIGNLNVFSLLALIALAAVVGDTVNYWIGFHVGERIFIEKKLINIKYLHRAEQFYSKNGAKTIFLARFIPIIRTFAPFVAGVGKMRYPVFLLYNIVGAIVWTSVFVLSGYFLGNVTFVKEHFSILIIVIILISLIPLLVEFFRQRKSNFLP